MNLQIAQNSERAIFFTDVLEAECGVEGLSWRVEGLEADLPSVQIFKKWTSGRAGSDPDVFGAL